MSDVSFGVLTGDENIEDETVEAVTIPEEQPDRSLQAISRRSTVSDLLPERPVSNAELLEAERATPDDPGFIQSFQNAWEIDTFTSALWQSATGEHFESDENFSIEQDRVIADAQERGIPAHYLRHISDSQSEAHYQAQLDRAARSAEVEQMLAAQGWGGFGIRMLAAVLDPVAIGAGIATEGVGMIATTGMTLSRAARVARIGLIAGATEGSMEAYRATTNPEVQLSDVLLVSLFATGLGGAAGAIGRTPGEIELARADAQRIAREGAEALSDEPDEITLAGSGGAARNPAVVQPISDNADDWLDGVEASDLASKTAQTSVAGIPGLAQAETLGALFGNSVHAGVRFMGQLLVGDQVGRAAGSRTAYSAAESTIRFHNAAMTRGMNALNGFYRQWHKTAPRGERRSLSSPFRGRRNFYQEVARQVRRPGHSSDESVIAAADEMRTVFNDLRIQARNAGVDGFDEIEFNPNYVPRMFDHDNIRRLINEFGQEQLGHLVARAVGNGNATAEGIEEGIAYIRTVEKLGSGHRVWSQQGLGKVGLDETIDILRREGELSDDVAERVATLITGTSRSDPQAPSFGSARHRVDMDEGFEAHLTGATGGRVVRIDELFENNMERLLNSYSRRLGGWVGLSSQAGIRSRSDFQRFAQYIRDTGVRTGVDTDDLGEQVRQLEGVFDYITGVPIQQLSERSATLIDNLKRFQFMRVMSQVGWAQAAELGSVAGQSGWGTFLRHMPELLSFHKRALNGTLEDDFLSDLEQLFGFGGMTVRGNAMGRVDSLGSDGLNARGGTLTEYLHAGSRETSKWSGLGPITDRLQQMSARLFIHKLARQAERGVSFNNAFFNPMTARRFQQLGIDEAMWGRISTELKKPGRAEWRTSALGRKLRSFDFDDWDDLDARDAFLNAVHREVRRQVQENDVGSMRLWMSSGAASILLQFKGFMINSFTKQLRHGIHMRDITFANGFIGSAFFAGMAYYVQTYLKSLGREDAQDYREDRLDPKSVAFSGALGRSSFASIFPQLTDNVLWAYSDGDPDALLFSHYRTSGQDTTGWAVNPTADFAYNLLFETPGNIAGALTGESEFTEQELRRMEMLLPWYNAMGVTNSLAIINNELDLPQRD